MRKQGFSLVEILVAITIAGVVMAAVMLSYGRLTQTEIQVQKERQIQKETNFMFTRLTDFLRDMEVQDACLDTLCLYDDSNDIEYTISHRPVPSETDRWNVFINDEPFFSDIFTVPNFTITHQDTAHPLTTMTVKVEHVRDENVHLELRTSISSRRYSF